MLCIKIFCNTLVGLRQPFYCFRARNPVLVDLGNSKTQKQKSVEPHTSSTVMISGATQGLSRASQKTKERGRFLKKRVIKRRLEDDNIYNCRSSAG